MRLVQCPLTSKVKQLMVRAFKTSDVLGVVTVLMRAQQKHYHILPASLNFIGIKDRAPRILEHSCSFGNGPGRNKIHKLRLWVFGGLKFNPQTQNF